LIRTRQIDDNFFWTEPEQAPDESNGPGLRMETAVAIG
jgi:hypothetical protein